MNKEIEQLINEFAKKRYQEGYDDGYKDGAKSGYMTSYNEGLNDAGECARKLVGTVKEGGFPLYSIFENGNLSICEVFEKRSASEVIAEIKKYEEKQKQKDDEIRVGDEVSLSDSKYVVVMIINESILLCLDSEGDWRSLETKTLIKTGKHYSQIDEVLKELRGDAE